MSETVITQVVQISPRIPAPGQIQQAAALLRAGRLVAFPTETVYGLGANALDADAINRIYTAKQRPASDPVIAHIHRVDELAQLAVDVPDVAYRLAEDFWPGPLTLVLQRAPNVPANIATGMPTIAVRMPAHPVAVALLTAANLPIAAPSANTFTRPSATTAAHVLEDLDGRVDMILDGGPTTIGLESTVLDLTGAQPVVLRPGGATLDALRTLLPDLQIVSRYVDDEATTSPGQMLKHYSPRAQVILFTGPDKLRVLAAMHAHAEAAQQDNQRVGILIAESDKDYFPETSAFLEILGDNLHTISRRLFAGLRALDARGVDLILARDFGQAGLGVALYDRLLRAAEGNVVHVE